MPWIDEAIQHYTDFVKEHTKATLLDGQWYSISTPFWNMFNDYIEIYCCNKNGKIYLSDGGETLQELDLAGIDLSFSGTKRKLINQIIRNYGVKRKKQKLFLETDMEHFAQAEHSLINAILEISHLYVLSTPNIISCIKKIDKRI